MFAKSCVLFALSSILVAALAQNSVLERGENYIVQKASDVKFNHKKSVFYKWTEIKPTNQTAPEDYGGNFGDLIFHNYPDEELLSRDTLLNQKIYNESVMITYARTFEGYETHGIMSLNFGRERGYTKYVGIALEGSYSEAGVFVAPGKQVRVFVETYGIKKK